MSRLSLAWPQGARELIHEAETQVDLVKLIMDGNCDIESWLIPNQILPALAEQHLSQVHLTLVHDAQGQTASVVPLPDGSAFACHVSGKWLALDAADASHEMAYIGSRFAPADHWSSGFSATLERPGGEATALAPTELAAWWTEITGRSLHGFAVGLLDHLEAIGYSVADKVFHTQGRLGL